MYKIINIELKRVLRMKNLLIFGLTSLIINPSTMTSSLMLPNAKVPL